MGAPASADQDRGERLAALTEHDVPGPCGRGTGHDLHADMGIDQRADVITWQEALLLTRTEKDELGAGLIGEKRLQVHRL